MPARPPLPWIRPVTCLLALWLCPVAQALSPEAACAEVRTPVVANAFCRALREDPGTCKRAGDELRVASCISLSLGSTSPCARFKEADKALCTAYGRRQYRLCETSGASKDDVLLCTALLRHDRSRCSKLGDPATRTWCQRALSVSFEDAPEIEDAKPAWRSHTERLRKDLAQSRPEDVDRVARQIMGQSWVEQQLAETVADRLDPRTALPDREPRGDLGVSVGLEAEMELESELSTRLSDRKLSTMGERIRGGDADKVAVRRARLQREVKASLEALTVRMERDVQDRGHDETLARIVRDSERLYHLTVAASDPSDHMRHVPGCSGFLDGFELTEVDRELMEQVKPHRGGLGANPVPWPGDPSSRVLPDVPRGPPGTEVNRLDRVQVVADELRAASDERREVLDEAVEAYRDLFVFAEEVAGPLFSALDRVPLDGRLTRLHGLLADLEDTMEVDALQARALQLAESPSLGDPVGVAFAPYDTLRTRIGVLSGELEGYLPTGAPDRSHLDHARKQLASIDNMRQALVVDLAASTAADRLITRMNEAPHPPTRSELAVIRALDGTRGSVAPLARRLGTELWDRSAHVLALEARLDQGQLPGNHGLELRSHLLWARSAAALRGASTRLGEAAGSFNLRAFESLIASLQVRASG